MSNASDAELEDYLNWIVRRMGMDASRKSFADVIQDLHAIELREPSTSATSTNVE